MNNQKKIAFINALGALAFLIFACIMGYRNIGLPPVIIIGGSGTIGFILWYRTYLWNPIVPKVILPLFMLTVAGLQIHLVEEYLTGFGPAMSRLFDISWTEKSFLMIFVFIGPIVYTLTSLGLFFKVRIAGFIAWFIFIGPGFAEFTHFIFPLMVPAIQPENAANVDMIVRGTLVTNMPNYYYGTTGHYYFSGMWTAILPMLPGGYAIIHLIRESKIAKPWGKIIAEKLKSN
ncbi:hypothetical protein [Leptospira alstonii]|uniref:Lipoprotein n=2 Tax=Leptospira alstonii TaxID=28452 RepID=T0H311_9LEPT|nr:hypothetical protein [Leptospira alstonii]EMJ95477.1 putative lipoprotein [Leptospira alstonii serovar Sichuan str. 79601]EQA80029.1 putative lipoprotein [Leptospira alstonii serovar Pingchang str. 80-412]